MRFSNTTQSFYPSDIYYPTLPVDISNVTQADYELAMSRPCGTTLDLVNGKIVIVPAPLPTAAQLLDAAKTAQLSAMEAAYQTAITAPIVYMAATFQADAASQDLLDKAIGKYSRQGSVPAGFWWKDAENNHVAMTLAQLQGFGDALGDRLWMNYQTLDARKTTIRNATTVAAVNAVTW